MPIRVLDLDGAIARQETLLNRYQIGVVDFQDWGPRIRLGCRFGRFRQFENALTDTLGERETEETLTLYGSGDFHHVSLALLRRQRRPFNLLVLDNHPDWMRAIPFLHCGTWLNHAACLPQVQQVFHVGGNMDFDNAFRRLAPWPLLRAGKVRVFPAIRYFRRGAWGNIINEPVRPNEHSPVSSARLDELLLPYRSQLASYPLYISLDKDVMAPEYAAVNWDSGHLTLPEVEGILKAFVKAAGGNLLAMDILGDWSPVQTRGLLRRLLHWTEHPKLATDPEQANRLNQWTNLVLLKTMSNLLAAGWERIVPLAA